MIYNYSTVNRTELESIEREIDAQSSLQNVLTWAAQQPKEDMHPQIVAEVVTQDEFTHDVIVPYRGLFLVYDTT